MNWELVSTAVLTTVFTTTILFIKEAIQNKTKTKRAITEQQFIELYNLLFSKSLLHLNKLVSSFYVIPEGMLDYDGKLFHEGEREYILASQVWDAVIVEIRIAIHSKLHLMDMDDIEHWSKIDWLEYEERFYPNTLNMNKYRALETFLGNINEKYKELHKVYHLK